MGSICTRTFSNGCPVCVVYIVAAIVILATALIIIGLGLKKPESSSPTSIIYSKPITSATPNIVIEPSR